MLDAAIEAFFTERKEAWLKKNLKASMDEYEVREQELECETIFALKNWLPNAAKRIDSRALTTHPSKFSHPSTGVGKKNRTNGTYVTPVIFKGTRRSDGFVRTGNIASGQIDSVGNAAELDVEDFLRLKMSDGLSLIDHIEQETDLAKRLLSIDGQYDLDLRNQFLVIKKSSENVVTNSKVKQVYFPVVEEKGYHLLSTLTNSGHIFEMRQRLDRLRFSEEAKTARELRKNNQFSATGYQEIYNLTTIGYGGTKPANISVLNNQNAGKAHLLLSMPPELTARSVRLPTRNFFGDVLYPKQLQQTFEAFHRLLNADYNNARIRKARDYRIQEYLDQLLLKMWQVRSAFGEQLHTRPEHLVAYQKYWLFPEHEAERTTEAPWLTTLIEDAARHFIHSYQKVAGKSAIQLSDTELQAFSRIIEQNKEALL